MIKVGDKIEIINYDGDTGEPWVIKGKPYKVIALGNSGASNYYIQILNERGRPWWILKGTYKKYIEDYSKYSETELIKTLGYRKGIKYV